jgi:hypothetical protein
MAPKDRTPHFGEIVQPPNRTIPQPKPGEERDEPVRGNPDSMAVDVEDEEADPVIDSGPRIDDGVKSLKKQRG